jgi:hypothetical protein
MNSSKRLFYLLSGLVAFLVVAVIASALVLNNMLQKQSATIASEKQQLAVLQGRQTALVGAKSDIKKYQNLAAIASSIVPQDKDEAETVQEIVNIADANGVSLGGFTFPASTLGTTGVSSGTIAPATPATTLAAPKLSLSQLTPVTGLGGVYALTITVQSDPSKAVPFTHFLAFLQGLENNRRTALVTAVTITPDTQQTANIGFNLTLQEYIKL